MDHNDDGNKYYEGDASTEGKRQFYKKSWWIPVAGLAAVALCFALIGYFGLSVAGTDKWGKTEQCENNGKCCEGEKSCKEGEECKDKGACKDEKGMKETAAPVKDSASATAAPTMNDSASKAKPAETK